VTIGCFVNINVFGTHQNTVIYTLLLQQLFEVHILEQKIYKLMQYDISYSPHKRRSIVLMKACGCIVEKVVIRPTTVQRSNIAILSK
jgi:hypothetical protein